MAKRESARKLKWLLRFASLDIERLNREDLLTELTDFIVHIQGPLPIFNFELEKWPVTENSTERVQRCWFDIEIIASEPNRKELIQCQRAVLEYLAAFTGESLLYPGKSFHYTEPGTPLYFKAENSFHRVGSRIIAYPLTAQCFVFESLIETPGKSDNLNWLRDGPDTKIFEAQLSVLVFDDMWSAIGVFLMPIFQDLDITRILRCENCKRYEFTNKKKQESLCSRCLTKARVERYRERQRKKYGKSPY
ncbi:MAG: hypothetical protein JSU72_13175 [Deltaproteobacteria bacterium]|nr:MAG: hypothetical protein JSU72_13175 [Deltaproteobacteria bacterium]